MNYREVTARLDRTIRDMRREIPNYYQSRIDTMLKYVPDKVRNELTIFTNKFVIELVGWEYKGIKLMQVNPTNINEIYACKYEDLFCTDEDLINN